MLRIMTAVLAITIELSVANLTPLGLKRNNDKTALIEDGYLLMKQL
jgi:hypothetical protein